MAKPNVTVNRKFLLALANDIYDPKTRKFLRLCDGTLQNGPDPTDEDRPMHCGLGELYFAMTGRQPKEDNVNEEGVIDLAVDLSTLGTIKAREEAKRETIEKTAETAIKQAIAVIKAAGLPKEVAADLADQVESNANVDLDDHLGDPDAEYDEAVTAFRDALDEIPGRNDDGKGDDCSKGGSCSYEVFRARSARVAKQLREAAALLPE